MPRFWVVLRQSVFILSWRDYSTSWSEQDQILYPSFLCTRVKAPTEQDFNKWIHLLGCLKRTQDHTLILRPRNMFHVEAYIDTSLATHLDGKSHMGVVALVGGIGAFFVSSVGGWTGPVMGRTSPLLVEPVTVLCYQLRYYVTNKKWNYILEVCVWERETE
jgi:hypothetical protein